MEMGQWLRCYRYFPQNPRLVYWCGDNVAFQHFTINFECPKPGSQGLHAVKPLKLTLGQESCDAADGWPSAHRSRCGDCCHAWRWGLWWDVFEEMLDAWMAFLKTLKDQETLPFQSKNPSYPRVTRPCIGGVFNDDFTTNLYHQFSSNRKISCFWLFFSKENPPFPRYL